MSSALVPEQADGFNDLDSTKQQQQPQLPPRRRSSGSSSNNNKNNNNNSSNSINNKTAGPGSSEKSLVDDSILDSSNSSSGPGTLPDGWQHAYDDQGAIYYFNERTGESRWDRPDGDNVMTTQLHTMSLSPPLSATTPTTTAAVTTSTRSVPPPRHDEEVELQSGLEKLNPFELKQLQLDQLQPEWIRQQGFIQMKMTAEKEDGGGKLSSWKIYHAVLSKGFLILYKDSLSKAKKYSKPLTPVGCFDLDDCRIEPAGKGDTKRKHSFLINTPRKVTIYIQTSSEKELSAWLDAIMRELIARKENQNEESDILRLLRKLTSDSEQMKVNRKMSRKKETDDRDWRHRLKNEPDEKGRPKKIGNWFGKPGRTTDKLPPQRIAGNAPQQPLGNELFGGFLITTKEGDVPPVVRMCVEEVEARGLTTVGIYRLSGPASSIQRYRTAFNCDEPVSFEDADINAVTGLLKLYFRELKNPLMTFEYYDWFIDAAREPEYDDRMYRIKATIHVLPKANFTVLEYLMRHLHRVAEHCEINKMEPSNLALIFSVGLLRPPADDLSGIMQTDLQSKVIEAIIQQVDWFFEKDDEGDEEQQLVQEQQQQDGGPQYQN
ncbi:Rho GTPase activation protein [Zychaea mexicana]|uniref:Rho GTPase activation protein n=1 Tax=Zychaea mexicana TaxID=64656 RepID=UPI0022FEE556|nr:Rho GTPase activation protein [Zychaea mexicana]KAI9484648.1 Rho GTPase activation protein [Zychaea mexicana]